MNNVRPQGSGYIMPGGYPGPGGSTPNTNDPNNTQTAFAPTPTEGQTSPAPTGGSTGGGWAGAGWPTTAGNGSNTGGQNSSAMPWLQPYGGQFTAPMSPYETGALNSYGTFAAGGSGTAPAQGYYGDVMGGKYLNFASNPWLQQIQSSGQQIKDYQDQQALRRINSSMAAGGNALSGANAQAQGDYLNQSGANFQNVMGNLFNQDYANERNQQANAASGSLGAGWQQGLGLQNLFNMGGLPRNLQQNDLNANYSDWQRQMGGAQNAWQYPDQAANALMNHGYPGSSQPNYGTAPASSWASILQNIFGGQGGGGVDWSSILSGLGSGGDTTGAPAGSAADAEPAYDGTSTAGPSSYRDAGWYTNALAQANKSNAAALSGSQNTASNTASGILGLIAAALGAYQNQKKKAAANKLSTGNPSNSSGNNSTRSQNNPFGSVSPYDTNGTNQPGDPFGSSNLANTIGPDNLFPQFSDTTSPGSGGDPYSIANQDNPNNLAPIPGGLSFGGYENTLPDVGGGGDGGGWGDSGGI